MDLTALTRYRVFGTSLLGVTSMARVNSKRFSATENGANTVCERSFLAANSARAAFIDLTIAIVIEVVAFFFFGGILLS